MFNKIYDDFIVINIMQELQPYELEHERKPKRSFTDVPPFQPSTNFVKKGASREIPRSNP